MDGGGGRKRLKYKINAGLLVNKCLYIFVCCVKNIFVVKWRKRRPMPAISYVHVLLL